jgi:hypothetical protein
VKKSTASPLLRGSPCAGGDSDRGFNDHGSGRGVSAFATQPGRTSFEAIPHLTSVAKEVKGSNSVTQTYARRFFAFAADQQSRRGGQPIWSAPR